jgi:hypothetical protein
LPTNPELVKVNAGIASPKMLLNAFAVIARDAAVMLPMLPVAVVGKA